MVYRASGSLTTRNLKVAENRGGFRPQFAKPLPPLTGEDRDGGAKKGVSNLIHPPESNLRRLLLDRSY
jgi:hypothetical protein